MTLSPEEFLDIEKRNEKRKGLRAELSKGRWIYESFAWLEVESRPYKERTCILLRRNSWFEKLIDKYGTDFLDKGTTGGNLKNAKQPAFDGLYLEAALNDPIEEDILMLLREIRRLRTDLPPPPDTKGPQKAPNKRKATKGRDLPVGSRKGDKPIYDTEREFREWFEDNLDHFGFKRVVLSQEPCPDYVLETVTGEVLRVETELFAANFISHGHDPRQVDKIVACFSEEDHIGGIPVLAANNLREYNPSPVVNKMTIEDLSMNERRVLGLVMMSGGIELSALAQQGFEGNLFLYKRVPPELVKKLKGVRIQDSLLHAIGRETRQFIRRFHHVLLGAGLSDELCDALKGLEMRGLIALRPLDLLSALHDGIFLDHKGWVPTEVYATKEAKLKYRVDAQGELIKR